MLMGRVKFKRGFQRKFIMDVCRISNFNLKQLSEKIGVNYNTFKNYSREQLLIPEELLFSLSSLSGINVSDLNILTVYQDNWGASKGGRKGIKVLFSKYKTELKAWRKKGARVVAGKNKKEIKEPKIDEALAEFVGSYLGDGTLTKYLIRIFGDPNYDLPYFIYLDSLVRKIFGIAPSISINKRNVLVLTVSSREVCKFLNERLRLPYGDKIKNKSKIPIQLLSNSSLMNSCLRGLVDTDGFIGKSNNRLKVVFSSHNKHLLSQVYNLNKILFNEPYKTSIEISSRSKINKYLKIVGSSNLRHIIRAKEYIDNGALLLKREVLPFYTKYERTNLPYMGPWSSGYVN